MEIIPAIIGKDFDEVEEKILSVEKFVKWVQLDIMDGLFTPMESWPYFDIKESPKDLEYVDLVRTDNTKVEVHLMIKNPERTISKWIEAGADRVLVHYESTSEDAIKNILEELDQAEVESGIVLKYETPISVLDKFIDSTDVVQLMSIGQIGFYGHPLEDGIYDKIKSLRAKYPGVTISIDGGVNMENAGKLLRAGADNLVVGSAIMNASDPGAVIRDLRRIMSTE